MTWAARYSATEEPELTIWRDGVEVWRVNLDRAVTWLYMARCTLDHDNRRGYFGEADAILHDPDLRDDIAARVPVRECDRPACALHAIGQGLCVLHGGRDDL